MATCVDFNCSGHANDLHTNPSSIDCVGDECTETECCTVVPSSAGITCVGFDCSGHANDLHANPSSIDCVGDPCTRTECCTVVPPTPPVSLSDAGITENRAKIVALTTRITELENKVRNINEGLEIDVDQSWNDETWRTNFRANLFASAEAKATTRHDVWHGDQGDQGDGSDDDGGWLSWLWGSEDKGKCRVKTTSSNSCISKTSESTCIATDRCEWCDPANVEADENCINAANRDLSDFTSGGSCRHKLAAETGTGVCNHWKSEDDCEQTPGAGEHCTWHDNFEGFGSPIRKRKKNNFFLFLILMILIYLIIYC